MPHEVEELERRGWNALSGPDGAAFYDDLMAANGIMVFPGSTLDKPAVVRAIAAERPWSRHHLEDVRVVEARETAVVSYRATSQREGEPEYRARMSSVYGRIDGRWRLLLHQQSPESTG